MGVVFNGETAGEIDGVAADVIPLRGAVGLAAELNAIFVLVIVGLGRGPILVGEWFAGDPGPSAGGFGGTGGLNPAEPGPVAAIPDGGVLFGEVEDESIFGR